MNENVQMVNICIVDLSQNIRKEKGGGKIIMKAPTFCQDFTKSSIFDML